MITADAARRPRHGAAPRLPPSPSARRARPGPAGARPANPADSGQQARLDRDPRSSENPSSRARACSSPSRNSTGTARRSPPPARPFAHDRCARRGLCDPIRRVGVVEHDFRPAGPAREFAERREHRLLSQIGRDAEPQHEGRSVRVEPRGLKRGGHASAFEIVSDIGDMRRFGDLRLGEPASLLAWVAG